jgi:excisionase family DNA binding protein
VTDFAFTVPDSIVETIAERAAALVLEQLADAETSQTSPYLTVAEAADYARCSKQRIYDLLSARRLERRRDGSRVLVLRPEIDAYLAGRSVASGLPPARQPAPRAGSRATGPLAVNGSSARRGGR